MNHPQLQVDGEGGGQPVYYESMEVEGMEMAPQFQLLPSMISGHEEGGIISGNHQASYANPEQRLPLPPMSCLRRPEYIYSQPNDFPISVSQNNDMLVMAVPHPIRTVAVTGTGQVPYYHHQLPVNPLELEVVRSPVAVPTDNIGANSLQIENGQGQRNIYDIGEQVVAKVTSRNLFTGNSTGETGGACQYPQQDVGVMMHTVEVPVAPTVVQSTAISGEPTSQSPSTSQISHYQQSVIRHTEEFSQNNPVPISRSATEPCFKLNTSRASRPLRVMPPQRKSGARIIQLQYQSRPPQQCYPPATGIPPTQQQIIVTSHRGGEQGIGMHYPRRPGMSRGGHIPVVDINDSDDEDNAAATTEGLISTCGNAIQKRNLSPSLTVSQSMVPIVPPGQYNMVREQWSTPPPPAGEQPCSSSMFYTSNNSETIQTVTATPTPQGTDQVKKKRNYTPRKRKQSLAQQQGGVLDVAGIVTTEIEGAAVKPKRKSTPKKPKQPPAGVTEVPGNVASESGDGTVKPKRRPTQRKPKQQGRVTIAGVAGNVTSETGEITATVKPKRKYTPRKSLKSVTPNEEAQKCQNLADLVLKVVSGGGISDVPIKPKRNYTRKPKVPPPIPPSAAPTQDNVSPMPSNSGVIDDPSLSPMVNVQPRPQTSEIPQDVHPKSYPTVGVGFNLTGSTSPKRGGGRGSNPTLSNVPKMKIVGTRLYTNCNVPSPDIIKCTDIIDTEGKLINNESIESGIMVEDGLKIRGNNGENLIILNCDTKNDTLMDSSEAMGSLVGDDSVKTLEIDKTMLPIPHHQPQNIVHGNVETGGTKILTDVLVNSSCETESETEDDDDILENFQTNSEAQSSTIARIEIPIISGQTEDYKMESAELNQGDIENPKDRDERLGMEVDQLSPTTPQLETRPCSRGKRQHSTQMESSLSEDNSDSIPYSARLKRKKRNERLNSGEKTRSSFTETGSENDDGTLRRTTRSVARNRSGAHDPYQSKENVGVEEDRSSRKGKRKLEYSESDSRTDEEWTNDDDDSSNDETVTIRKPNYKNNSNGRRPGTVERGTRTKFGRGRGRGRGRPPLNRSIVKNRVVKTAKGIARKMTHAKIVSSMDNAMKTLQIQNNVTKHQKQLEHDEEEPLNVLEHHSVDNNWDVRTEPEMFRVKSDFAPQCRPQYTDEEREMLYGDQRFVVDLNDYDKDPENMFIWQIHEDARYLRQYYPSKYAGRQFHSSSSVMWFFSEEDFKSEAFYNRFQPIVVIVASTKVCFPQTKYADAMVERVVQFVYIDKIFFAQMAKHLGRIHKTEKYRSGFMDSLPVFTMTAIVPQFLKVAQDDSECFKKFQSYIFAWQGVSEYITTQIDQACNTSYLSKETFDYLIHFPDLSYSIKNVNTRKTCSACPEKGGTPVVRVTFGLKDLRPKPYNLDTLEELPLDQTLKLPNETLYWCQSCSRAAKTFHRFYHFRYSMHRVVKQNMAKDVAMFRRCNAEVTDTMLMWIMKTEKSWQNAMFLDFQVCAAELEAVFGTKTAVETEVVSNAAVEMECTNSMDETIEDLIN